MIVQGTLIENVGALDLVNSDLSTNRWAHTPFAHSAQRPCYSNPRNGESSYNTNPMLTKPKSGLITTPTNLT